MPRRPACCLVKPLAMRRPLLPLLAFLLAAAAPTGTLPAQSVSFTTLRQLFPNTEGRLPYAPLVQGADGFLYGTASRGGSQDQGTVFRCDANGGSFAVLYTFNGPPGDGARPEGGLVQGRDGLFYGATLAGGINDRGLLYRLAANGGFQPLAAFNLGFPGATPTAQLVEGFDGNLYGSAEFGGGFSNFGTVFRVGVPDGSLTQITQFVGSPDAASPAGRLLALITPSATNDFLYGATLAGGSANLGTIFRVTVDGVHQPIYSFTGNADGALPRPLTLGPDDATFYGLTRSGGDLNYGSIFRLTPFGSFIVLYTFNPTDGTGYDALAELLLASDGNLYGTTRRGGAFDAGTVFRVTTSGGYATLYSFTGTGSDGGYPQAALTQGSDGRLFGVAAGQQGQAATVFRLDLGLPRPQPVVRALGSNSGNVGGALALVGEHLVGATGVRFTAPTGGTAAVAGLNVVSATYATLTVPAGAGTGPLTVLDATGQPGPVSVPTFTVNSAPAIPPFFAGATDVGNGFSFLPSFGYFKLLPDNPGYVFHNDLGFLYFIDANDGKGGIYFYDFATPAGAKSLGFFYTAPAFPFPYLYSFELKAFLYYFPDDQRGAGFYTTTPRVFVRLDTGEFLFR